MTPDLSCSNLPAMLDCGTIPVWVTEVRYTGGAVAYGRGDTEDGEAVHFAAEPRALYAIAEALGCDREPVRAIVPTWALL